jgi:DNA-binding LytR/AlgR family response regulator
MNIDHVVKLKKNGKGKLALVLADESSSEVPASESCFQSIKGRFGL